MKKFIKVMTVIMLVLVSMISIAQNTVYYNNYKQWTPELESKANAGDIVAMVCLGSCYDRGAGTVQDRNKAYDWFAKAASKGDLIGIYDLALYYSRGYVKDRDNVRAVKLLNEVIAKDKTFTPAYLTLAKIYEEGGGGISRNFSLALDNWEALASSGDNMAQYIAGQYYQVGKAGTKNIKKAKDYYLKSAEQNNVHAMDDLASCYLSERNFQQAFKWLKEAYDRGYLRICHNLGDCYYYGNGVPQSYEKAYEVFSKGSSEWPRCKYRMSVMLREGLGVTKNLEKAAQLLEEAADTGIDKAQYQLASDFYTGTIQKQDYAKAVKYYEAALESKYLPNDVKSDICRKCSTCYRFGRGVKADEDKADEYLKKASDLGDSDAKKIQSWLNLSQNHR